MKRTRTSRAARNCRLRAGGSREEGRFSVNLGEIGRAQAVISTPHALNRRALQGNPLTEPNTPLLACSMLLLRACARSHVPSCVA